MTEENGMEDEGDTGRLSGCACDEREVEGEGGKKVRRRYRRLLYVFLVSI